jgi:hypothetical protein
MRPISAIAEEIHYEPLAPDVCEAIVQSWRNLGILPAATVEQLAPARLEK